MQVPPIPLGEKQRLRALHDYRILDTPAEDAFDGIVQLAAHVAQVPIALVSLVDADRKWFKSRHGLDKSETARDVSFCGHVVASGAPLIVPDTHADERFHDNPLVVGPPYARFYAAMPLRNGSGHTLGSLCVLDTVPRTLTEDVLEMLRLLSLQVVDQVEVRAKNLHLATYERYFDLAEHVLCTMGPGLRLGDTNPAWSRILGWTPIELAGRPLADLIHPDDASETENALRAAPEQVAARFESRCLHRRGHWVSLRWSVFVEQGVIYGVATEAAA